MALPDLVFRTTTALTTIGNGVGDDLDAARSLMVEMTQPEHGDGMRNPADVRDFIISQFRELPHIEQIRILDNVIDRLDSADYGCLDLVDNRYLVQSLMRELLTTVTLVRGLVDRAGVGGFSISAALSVLRVIPERLEEVEAVRTRVENIIKRLGAMESVPIVDNNEYQLTEGAKMTDNDWQDILSFIAILRDTRASRLRGPQLAIGAHVGDLTSFISSHYGHFADPDKVTSLLRNFATADGKPFQELVLTSNFKQLEALRKNLSRLRASLRGQA